MEGMKHTPGPWIVDLETGEIEAQGAVLGTIYGADDYPCCEDDIDEECKANARLIAAAPELFAALQALNAIVIQLDLRQHEHIAAASIAAENAIRKAKGETE